MPLTEILNTNRYSLEWAEMNQQWLATRHDVAGEWSQAGQLYHLNRAGIWAASTDRKEWPDDEQFLAELEESWEEPWGDRRNELVVIGQDLDEERLRECLEACLLTEEEIETGPSVWSVFKDDMQPWPEEESEPSM